MTAAVVAVQQNSTCGSITVRMLDRAAAFTRHLPSSPEQGHVFDRTRRLPLRSEMSLLMQ